MYFVVRMIFKTKIESASLIPLFEKTGVFSDNLFDLRGFFRLTFFLISFKIQISNPQSITGWRAQFYSLDIF